MLIRVKVNLPSISMVRKIKRPSSSGIHSKVLYSKFEIIIIETPLLLVLTPERKNSTFHSFLS